MLYKKKKNDFKEIVRQWWVLIHSITWVPYTPNELIEVKENDVVINKKWFNKVFKIYSVEMNYDPKDYWYCILRANHWLDNGNWLSNKYLDKLKNEMSSVWVVKLLQRLIEKKMIARTWRGKYTLNPNIAQYWTTIDQSIYKLFE